MSRGVGRCSLSHTFPNYGYCLCTDFIKYFSKYRGRYRLGLNGLPNSNALHTFRNISTENKGQLSGDNTGFGIKGKITVENPVVEIKGDEMSQVIWDMVKQKVIEPYLNISLEEYDLSLEHRAETRNYVVLEAIESIRKWKVGIKCPTVTPKEMKYAHGTTKQLWNSTSVTLRNHLDGALFMEPIVVDNIPRLIRTWRKPIIVGRHIFGDQYRNKSMMIEDAGKLELVFTPSNPEKSIIKRCIYEFKENESGVCMGMYNTSKSIVSFARCCFRYCLAHELPLYLSIKDSVMKIYDGLFQSIFYDVYSSEFKSDFDNAGLWYEVRSVDEMITQVLKSEGGFVWACKNYDGDSNADLVGAGFGSKGLMTSSLVCPDYQTYVIEPAHGTITDHYREHIKGNKVSSNPLATIFSWTRGLHHRAKLDCNFRLEQFCYALEAACTETVESGLHTKDLCDHTRDLDTLRMGVDYLCTEDFVDEVVKMLKIKLVTFQTGKKYPAAAKRLGNRSY